MDGCEGNSIALTTSYGGVDKKSKKRKVKFDKVYKQKSVIPSKVMDLYQGKKGK